MHRFTESIMDITNDFQNTDVLINERVCVSPPPYYLDWFEKYYPNVHLNLHDGPFCLQLMNVIQVTKPSKRKRNWILDAMVTISKSKKIKIHHDIYIKILSDGTV